MAKNAQLTVLTSVAPTLFQYLLKLPAGQRKQPSKAQPPALLSQGTTSLKPRNQQRTTEGFHAGECEAGSAALERLNCQNRDWVERNLLQGIY